MIEYLFRRYQPPEPEVLEVLELHQLTLAFRQEQEYREAYAAYCERYDAIAQQHQREHAAMQNEPNLFALFWRKRSRPEELP
ncbi:MAG TPA: hypothetical protein V6D02_12095 [Candidatus Obscuribacterales bacterium]